MSDKRPSLKGIDVFLSEAQEKNITANTKVSVKNKKDKIQTALWLSRTAFKKLKLYAIKNDKTQSEVVEELINKYCDLQSVSVENIING
jgi:translation elongation factor EF-1beta